MESNLAQRLKPMSEAAPFSDRRGIRFGETDAARIVYSVRDKCRTLIDQLREWGSMPLSTLYSQCTSRSEIVATFLSVLELCSDGHIRVSGEEGNYDVSRALTDTEE